MLSPSDIDEIVAAVYELVERRDMPEGDFSAADVTSRLRQGESVSYSVLSQDETDVVVSDILDDIFDMDILGHRSPRMERSYAVPGKVRWRFPSEGDE